MTPSYADQDTYYVVRYTGWHLAIRMLEFEWPCILGAVILTFAVRKHGHCAAIWGGIAGFILPFVMPILSMAVLISEGADHRLIWDMYRARWTDPHLRSFWLEDLLGPIVVWVILAAIASATGFYLRKRERL